MVKQAKRTKEEGKEEEIRRTAGKGGAGLEANSL